MKFEGIYTPIITPHTEDGSIHKGAFAEVAEFLIDAGVHCIVVGGSTGEYYAQTNEERIELMNFAREIINKRVLLMSYTYRRLRDVSKSGKSSRSGLPAGQFSSVCGAD